MTRLVLAAAARLVVVVLFVELSGCSARIGCPPRFPDPAFGGTWSATGVELTIGLKELSDCPDRVFAQGVNNQPTAVWSLISFSGEVEQVGRAGGTAALWIESGAGIESVSFDLELLRTGDTLGFELDYTTSDGIRHLETYALQKQL